ncbi:AI-2E family transporter [Candidatus Woesearchaeota archaeon]|nr:AI-2E family transporter [Candidatus Woesearchaeota archaeon]
MVMKKEEYFKYFFLGFFVLIAYISYLIAQPFIGAILASFVLAYTFHPVYRWLVRRIRSPTLSALIVSFLLILLLIAPVFFFANDIVTDARVGYVIIKQKLATGNIFGVACPEGAETFACKITGPLKNVLADPTTNAYLQESISKGTTFLLTQLSGILLSLPKIILQLVVTFFLMFYLFIDGVELVNRSRRLIPLSEHHQHHILKKLQDVTFAVIYGSLIVALIQGALGGLGFWMFGVGSPLLWGIVMAILALVPLVGTAIVWLPASIFLMVLGASEADPSMVWRGIGLLLWGALVVSTIDNILKPKIIGDRAGLHPGLVLIGALGGLATVGFIGFVIGPLVLGLLKTLIDIYEKEELQGNGKKSR